MSGWQPIESAPRDGTPILLLSAYSEETDEFPPPGSDGIIRRYPKVALGKWNPDGTSWVDEHGSLGGDCYELAVTGTWGSGGGWFQPNEVTHWFPLPSPPSEAASPLGGPTLALEDLKPVPVGGDGEGSSCAMSGGTASPKSESAEGH